MTPTLRHHQEGVTLLESLVAIVVLSFGLLAMLGLFLNGLRMTSSSHYRTIAAEQLVAIADMINANPNLIATYSPPAANTGNVFCFTADCATTQVAPADFQLWQANVAASLPNGVGTVCLDASPADGNSSNFQCSGSGRPTVKICWNENARVAVSGGGGSGSDSSTDTCLTSQL